MGHLHHDENDHEHHDEFHEKGAWKKLVSKNKQFYDKMPIKGAFKVEKK